MSAAIRTIGIAALVAVAIGGGYWLGRSSAPTAVSTSSAPASEAPTKAGERKILYYRNPMGLPDTSPVPKKDPMGMDYIAVYEGEDHGGAVKVSADRIQALGVRTETVATRPLVREVRAVGSIEAVGIEAIAQVEMEHALERRTTRPI